MKMKSTSFGFTLFFLGLVLYFSVTRGEFPTQFRRLYDDGKILKGRKNNVMEKVGVPLAANMEKKSFMTTKMTGPHVTKDAQNIAADESSKAILAELKDNSKPAVTKNDHDSRDEDDEEENGKSKEETGSGYEDIADMGAGDDEDTEKDDSENKKGPGSSTEDDTVGDKEISQPGEVPDLSGEFPPSADQVFKLPNDTEMTPKEVDKKILDKYKGYFRFVIRQRFKPQFKYKESPAYKILAGNVIYDVERALRAKAVVHDVLFREAKNVGGPPYRSKVQVYLKVTKDISSKRLKKIIDYGLINGMITVPGSFHEM